MTRWMTWAVLAIALAPVVNCSGHADGTEPGSESPARQTRPDREGSTGEQQDAGAASTAPEGEPSPSEDQSAENDSMNDDGSSPSSGSPSEPRTPGDPTDEVPDDDADGEPNDESDELVCEPGQRGPDKVAVRRLTTVEIQSSLPVLFPGVSFSLPALPQPEVVEGFRTHVRSQPNNPLLIDSEFLLATEVGKAASEQRASWAPCTKDSLTCLEDVGDFVLLKAFRRPPTAEERERLLAVTREQFAAEGMNTAVEDLVTAVLLSPQFLYRLEFGVEDLEGDGPWLPLTGYEIATRLSFFLTGHIPDDEMLQAAAAGELDTTDGIILQTERLLDQEQVRDVVSEFFIQWLEVDALNDLELNQAAFPEFDDALVGSFKESLRRFVDAALWEHESLDFLLASDQVFVDERLARLLSVSESGEGFEARELPNRSGILTQPGLLASTSRGTIHSPIVRGLKVLQRFLCIEIPAPPPDVNAAIDPQDETNPVTTREHFEQSHKQPQCAGCHNLIDGVGFSFENYDALGRYVTEDHGAPVDSSGVVPLPSGNVDVANALELASVMRESRAVKRCVSEQWYRFTFGLGVEGNGGACEVEAITNTWQDTAGDPRAILLHIVTSNTFRFLPKNGL